MKIKLRFVITKTLSSDCVHMQSNFFLTFFLYFTDLRWFPPIKYYTLYHKRRVKITLNPLCGKILWSKLCNTPSLEYNTMCPEAIWSNILLDSLLMLWPSEYMYHRVEITRGLCSRVNMHSSWSCKS